MTAKEYLMKIYTYRQALIRIEQNIESLYESAGGLRGIAYDTDKVQTSPDDNLARTFIRIEKQREKWERLRVKYDEAVRIRIERVSSLDNPAYAEILSLRYIDLKPTGRFQTFEEISKKMGYTIERTWHIHGEALAAFARKYRL